MPASITVPVTVVVSAAAPPCVVTVTMAPLSISTAFSALYANATAVLQFGDLGLFVDRVFPVFVGTLVATLAIHAPQCCRIFGFDSFDFCQALQVPRVTLAGVAPYDGLHRRVGFQRGRIDADGLAFDEP